VDKIAIVRHVFVGTRRKEGDKVKLYNSPIWLQQQGPMEVWCAAGQAKIVSRAIGDESDE